MNDRKDPKVIAGLIHEGRYSMPYLPEDVIRLGADGINKIWRAAKLRGTGYGKALRIVSAANHSIGRTEGLVMARKEIQWAVEQLRGYLKWDAALSALVEDSSGKHEGKTIISKRGRRRLRYHLYQAALVLIAQNEEFREVYEYYLTREVNPLKKMQALMAAEAGHERTGIKDNAAYMRSALVAASAIFSDLGDLRKPEYLYRIVEDALNQGRMMKERVSEKIVSAGFSSTKKNIYEIVLWNRRTHTEHASGEIKDFYLSM